MSPITLLIRIKFMRLLTRRGPPPSGPKIHAFTQKFFEIHTFTQVFLEIHANPIFREIGKIFGKNRENCQKSGKFAQIWVKRENSRLYAKSGQIHAFTQ